jgi:hypothetical protein
MGAPGGRLFSGLAGAGQNAKTTDQDAADGFARIRVSGEGLVVHALFDFKVTRFGAAFLRDGFVEVSGHVGLLRRFINAGTHTHGVWDCQERSIGGGMGFGLNGGGMSRVGVAPNVFFTHVRRPSIVKKPLHAELMMGISWKTYVPVLAMVPGPSQALEEICRRLRWCVKVWEC